MERMKKVLKKLSEADMHVHEIDHGPGGYKGFPQPIAHLVPSTHFVMKGAEIVHVGNKLSVVNFVLAL